MISQAKKLAIDTFNFYTEVEKDMPNLEHYDRPSTLYVSETYNELKKDMEETMETLIYLSNNTDFHAKIEYTNSLITIYNKSKSIGVIRFVKINSKSIYGIIINRAVFSDKIIMDMYEEDYSRIKSKEFRYDIFRKYLDKIN